MEDSIKVVMTLCIIAEKAGEEILKISRNSKSKDFDTKEDGSPLTIADLNAHNTIISGLTKFQNEVPILSEEGSIGDPNSHEYCFLVDPLDGTKEFLRGNGMYTVNIAIMEKITKSKWKPIIGVVHAPELGVTWFGGKSIGATRKDNNGIKRISVTPSIGPPTILGSVSHSSPLDRAFANSVGEHIFQGVGSSIKICRVAEGSADLAPRFGTTSCWDTAAAHAILIAAGGSLVSPDGSELEYDLVGDILNPWFMATCKSTWTDLWVQYQREIIK